MAEFLVDFEERRSLITEFSGCSCGWQKFVVSVVEQVCGQDFSNIMLPVGDAWAEVFVRLKNDQIRTVSEFSDHISL